jgi:hypothetical protein
MDWTAGTPDAYLPPGAWHELERRLGKTRGLNPHNNGLYPDQTGRPPMTRFVCDLPVEDRFNIYAWAVRLLTTGQASEASTRLQRLHGVGPKIAAFFLRDMLVATAIPEEQIGGPHLVQPIDVWVRRAVVHLIGDDTYASEARDPAAMKRMVDIARELAVPGAALNCALWVLGARLACSDAALKRALTDPTGFSELVLGESRRAEGIRAALRASLGRFADRRWASAIEGEGL